MSSKFCDKYAIVGLGEKFGRVPGYTPRAFEAEAARLAIEDAGLKKEDIDVCIGGGAEPSTMLVGWTDAYARVLGIPAKLYTGSRRGGAEAALMMAFPFLDLGIARYVLIAHGINDWSGRHKEGAQELMRPMRPGLWGQPLGESTAVSFHSMLASRHMYEYGTTSRQLGAVAVAMRSWACLNPAAYMHGRPLTIEEHQNSPIICWPYHMLDMSLRSDGGTAFIVTTAERARDLRKPPVYIMGIGFGEHIRKLWWEKANYTQLDIEPAKTDAFRLAGIELKDIKDIDVAQLYDCFTGEVILELEGYGWCKKGEGGPFVEAGNIAPGGSIPVNTGGGLLSSHHHGSYTGLAEAVIQLRGEGGARQVKNAEICLACGHGNEILAPGMSSYHGTIILRR